MKIRLLSDLHHEFFKTKSMFQEPFFQYKGEDVLVLAGDIAVGANNVAIIIKEFLSSGFPKVVYVPGNHEYYGRSINTFNSELKDKLESIDNAYFLDGSCVTIEDVAFIGGTLWTNFRDDPVARSVCGPMISDFRTIYNFSPLDASNKFYDHLDDILYHYEQNIDKKKVIVTHFLPTTECINEKYRGNNLVNNYFANDLSNIVNTLHNTTWLFGHTHDSVDIVLGTTRLVCNPHGYHGYERDNGFDPYLQITV